ncbi:hypothetical protein Bpfe_004774 [Biomphalaria pfeifferi]|uniref:Uncharacterized protein n=1 Tax=Biomphalaria pfeifferi TaxID=112525 RepID=A0AAD8C4Y4_BIOPF|nr:hypothetical protein Bpfe_004774 [Biomphalaria pfeifferi]
MAANLVLQINKLGFINSKGDPKGFVCFLIKNNLPKGLVPRYRGNRLHILFHICGLFIHHYTILLDFCKKLQSRLWRITISCCDETAKKKQMCALGMVGKLLTAPWLKLFYIPKTERMAYFKAIEFIKDALERIKKSVAHPLSMLWVLRILVWNSLIVFSPKDEELENMLKLCLTGVAEVIEKQYVNLFNIIPNENIENQTETY